MNPRQGTEESSDRLEPLACQVRTSLAAILDSPQFSNSAQLSRFLSHIVENRLAGNWTALKESAIGTEVFRRGPGYDPKADPIVRVEARRLRSRLESYYQSGGAADPVRISLPKGGYVPLLLNLKVEDPETVEPPLKPVPAASGRRLRWPWAVAACLLAVSGALTVGMSRAGAPARLTQRFWTSLLGAERPALLIVADSGLVLLQDLTRKPVALQDYTTGEYLAHAAGDDPATGAPRYRFGARRYTAFADLNFALQLDRRPEARPRGVVVRYARDVRAEDLKTDSVVLLGARQSNPWVELFENQAAFRLAHDESTGDFRLLNLRPAPGESAQILVTPENMLRETYGIVSYHRHRHGAGWVLMLRGTSVAGTEAAAQLLLDDARLRPWLEKADGPNGLRGFDILIHNRNLGGSATAAEVISFRPDAAALPAGAGKPW